MVIKKHYRLTIKYITFKILTQTVTTKRISLDNDNGGDRATLTGKNLHNAFFYFEMNYFEYKNSTIILLKNNTVNIVTHIRAHIDKDHVTKNFSRKTSIFEETFEKKFTRTSKFPKRIFRGETYVYKENLEK